MTYDGITDIMVLNMWHDHTGHNKSLMHLMMLPSTTINMVHSYRLPKHFKNQI